MTEAIQQLVNALSLGSIYALAALGVAIVFSILRLINFAHGELITVAGYTMFFLLSRDAPWAVALPAAVAMSVLAAMALERVAYRRLRGAQPLTLLLTSYGVSLALQSAFLLAFGARPKPIPYPGWVDTVVILGTVRIQALDLFILAVTIAIVLLLNLFLRRSVMGLALRSAADDFRTTRLMGIPANAVVVGAFVVSGALAGLAALFFFARSPVVTPGSGFDPMLMGFVATVVGGLGSLAGAVLGGFILAGFQVLCEALLSDSLNPYVNAIVFGLTIAVLRFRPSGILGLRLVENVRA